MSLEHAAGSVIPPLPVLPITEPGCPAAPPACEPPTDSAPPLPPISLKAPPASLCVFPPPLTPWAEGGGGRSLWQATPAPRTLAQATVRKAVESGIIAILETVRQPENLGHLHQAAWVVSHAPLIAPYSGCRGLSFLRPLGLGGPRVERWVFGL